MTRFRWLVVIGFVTAACGGRVAYNAQPISRDGARSTLAGFGGTQAWDGAQSGGATTGGTTLDHRTVVAACQPPPATDEQTVGVCRGLAVEVDPAPVSIVFLVDRSAAMAEPLPNGSVSAWTGVVRGIERFLDGNPDVGASIRFFGLGDEANADVECATASYTMVSEPLNPPMGSRDLVLNALQSVQPSGSGRPTAAAFAGTAEAAATLALACPWTNMPVMLITAGPPDECGDSIDLLAQRVREQRSDWTSTFVIQLGSGFDLNPAANAAGNGPVYLISSGDVADDLEVILDEVLAPGISSQFAVPVLPDDEHPIELNKTVVNAEYRQGGQWHKGVLPQLQAADDCASSEQGGWYLSYTGSEWQVVLCPCTLKLRNLAVRIGYFCD